MSSDIQLHAVRQVFDVRKEGSRALTQFVALDGLDLQVDAGEFRTLVGPSGCGKSTVLDLVSGLTRPSAGEVWVGGECVTHPGLDRSVVFQQYTLLPWRTAVGNVEFALEAVGGYSRKQRRERALEYLDLVGLSDFAHRFPRELSGGMKQRVAIARSLSYEPGVLLMDEPFGALDAQTRETLQEQLVDIWRRTGTTIVFITHDIEEALFLGQRVSVMRGRPGRVVRTLDVQIDRAAHDVRSSAQFAEQRHEIWQLLRGDSVTARAVRKGEDRVNAAR